MSDSEPELFATYWTICGDVYPGGPTAVSPFPLEARAAAASKAGYTGMGFVHDDLRFNAGRLGYPAMRRIFGDHGIRHVEVELLSDWYLAASDPLRRASDAARQELLEAAAELGARNLKISPRFMADDPPDIPRMRDEFGRLCEQARPAGTNVMIEMMPFTNLKTLDSAMAVIAGADQPNGGLLLDIWHLFRGGMGIGEIAKVPGRFLKGIELNDADAQVVGTLFEDTRFRRRLCGEGSFDIAGFMAAVKATGFDTPYYAVEILSESFRKQPLEVMARSSYDSTMRALGRA